MRSLPARLACSFGEHMQTRKKDFVFSFLCNMTTPMQHEGMEVLDKCIGTIDGILIQTQIHQAQLSFLIKATCCYWLERLSKDAQDRSCLSSISSGVSLNTMPNTMLRRPLMNFLLMKSLHANRLKHFRIYSSIVDLAILFLSAETEMRSSLLVHLLPVHG